MAKSLLKTKHFPKNLFEILSFLSDKGREAQVSEIMEKFKNSISKPVVNDIIMGLWIRNFIQKEEISKDRRRKRIILTDEGVNLKQKLEELAQIM